MPFQPFSSLPRQDKNSYWLWVGMFAAKVPNSYMLNYRESLCHTQGHAVPPVHHARVPSATVEKKRPATAWRQRKIILSAGDSSRSSASLPFSAHGGSPRCLDGCSITRDFKARRTPRAALPAFCKEGFKAHFKVRTKYRARTKLRTDLYSK